MVLKALMKAILVLVGVHVSLAVSGKSKRIAFADDISTSQHESQWFRATDCLAELNSWCQEWEGIRMWHCLDGFSYSRRVASSFEYFGYRACNFDIRCSKEQDILSRRGFFMALNQCMEFPGMECMGGYFSIILDILDALRLNFTKMNISWRFSLGFNGFHMVSCLVLIIPEVTHECRWMFFLQHFQCQTKVFPDLSWPFWLSLPRLMEHSLFMLAPPCSLLVPISSSVHRRNAACRTLCKFLQRFHMFSYVFHVFPNLRYVMACFIWRSVPPHSSITHIQDLVLKCFEMFWMVLMCVVLCWSMLMQEASDVWGNLKNKKVRMSNLVAENAAMLILLTLLWRPTTCIVVEQPKGSYLWKFPLYKTVVAQGTLGFTLTYFGLWGMDLLKGTHLASNLPNISHLARKANKENKARFLARVNSKFEKMRRAGQKVPNYYKTAVHPVTGKKTFSGGRDLQNTAIYPVRFCNALFHVWQRAYLSVNSPWHPISGWTWLRSAQERSCAGGIVTVQLRWCKKMLFGFFLWATWNWMPQFIVQVARAIISDHFISFLYISLHFCLKCMIWYEMKWTYMKWIEIKQSEHLISWSSLDWHCSCCRYVPTSRWRLWWTR